MAAALSDVSQTVISFCFLNIVLPAVIDENADPAAPPPTTTTGTTVLLYTVCVPGVILPLISKGNLHSLSGMLRLDQIS